jgi:hypothetical protein
MTATSGELHSEFNDTLAGALDIKGFNWNSCCGVLSRPVPQVTPGGDMESAANASDLNLISWR